MCGRRGRKGNRRREQVRTRWARLRGKNRRVTRPRGPRAPCVEGIPRTGAPHGAPARRRYSKDDTTRGRSSCVPQGGPPGPIRDTRTQMVKLSASPTPPRLASTGCAMFSCVCAALRGSQRSRGHFSSVAPTGRTQPAVHPQYVSSGPFCQESNRIGPMWRRGLQPCAGRRRLKLRLDGLRPRNPPARVSYLRLPSSITTRVPPCRAIRRLILHRAARLRSRARLSRRAGPPPSAADSPPAARH